MMQEAATAGQVSKTAAEIYDEFFVPALFGEWAERLCYIAKIAPGHTVLDVACGTGATTREAVARVGSKGRVVGLAVLEVAPQLLGALLALTAIRACLTSREGARLVSTGSRAWPRSSHSPRIHLMLFFANLA